MRLMRRRKKSGGGEVEQLLEALVEHELRALAPELKDWVPERVLRERLTGFLVMQLGRLTDRRFGESFRQSCPVEGTVAEDYRQKVLHVGDARLLCGIRFKGLQVDWPFVELVASDQPLPPGPALDAALETIAGAFTAFSPRWLRIHRPEGGEGFERYEVREDQRVVAAPLAQLLELPRPEGFERLESRRCRSLEFFPRYRAAYEEFLEACPQLRDEVGLSTRDELARCLDQGVVCEVTIEGQWAGMVAAGWEQEGPLAGWCIQEEVLVGRWRGQGLGAALQRHLIERLAPRQHALVHGTIHDTNVPSLRTALRVGRRSLWRYTFLGLPTPAQEG